MVGKLTMFQKMEFDLLYTDAVAVPRQSHTQLQRRKWIFVKNSEIRLELEAKALNLYDLSCGYKENWKFEYTEKYEAIQKELKEVLDALKKIDKR